MMEMLVAFGSVILINIVLSGDNAVVIAMAGRNLPGKQRKQAIFWGSALAVALRIMLVIVATFLLQIPFLRLAGGIALVYIGIRLLYSEDEKMEVAGNSGLGSAIRTILVADLIMSLDNVLAIAGVAKGNWVVLIVGLAVSVPLVVFGASLLSKLMGRFPIIAYIGAALIAYTAAEMMVTDLKVGEYLEPHSLILKIVLVVGVVGVGYLLHRRATSKKAEKGESES
ncbi:MAG: TerC family protein [Clostridiales bacterium]|nr:TerC family protein [Clostridiales bacterium]